MALQETTDDLFTVAAQSAAFRELLSIALEQNAALQRQLKQAEARTIRIHEERRAAKAAHDHQIERARAAYRELLTANQRLRISRLQHDGAAA